MTTINSALLLEGVLKILLRDAGRQVADLHRKKIKKITPSLNALNIAKRIQKKGGNDAAVNAALTFSDTPVWMNMGLGEEKALDTPPCSRG
jgi:hypothetical protein